MLIRRARRTGVAKRLLEWISIALVSISALALHQLSDQHGMVSAAPTAFAQATTASGEGVAITTALHPGAAAMPVAVVATAAAHELHPLVSICQESCQPVAAVAICLMAFVLVGRRLLLRVRLLFHWVECWLSHAVREFGVAGWPGVRLWWPEVSAQLLGISRT